MIECETGLFDSLFDYWPAWQVRQEIEQLWNIVRGMQPRTILEIGTGRGGTLNLWLSACQERGTVISVDKPRGPFGGGYRIWHYFLFKLWALKRRRSLILVSADSRSDAAVARVRESLNGSPLDFLFIDGDHTLAAVKRDFDLYSGLVRSGGLIALHDICKSSEYPECEVDKFWLSLKGRFRTEEIIQDAGQGWAGIGLVWPE